MLRNDAVDDDQSLVSKPTNSSRGVEIVNAPPVWLQTLDLARNVAIAANGNRYVVATFDDTRVSGKYITAVYPQQNGYLTLIRLVLTELKSDTPVQAMQLHQGAIRAIQQGKLQEFIRSHT
ncbi:MAG: hypothetical protein JO011_12425 [Ktedonobacteraceae bacterium]|nr:hypothetical protein [Ktedonobacteraceae bacterium]